MGGPDAYTSEHGGYPHMVAKHVGLSITANQRLRFVTLLSAAADTPISQATRSSAPRSWATRSGALDSRWPTAPPMPSPSRAHLCLVGAGAWRLRAGRADADRPSRRRSPITTAYRSHAAQPLRDLMERDRARRGDVERLGAARQRDRRIARMCCELVRQPLPLGAEDQGHRWREVEPSSGSPPCATSATRRPGASSKRTSGTRKIAPAEARSAFGAGGSAQPSDRATHAPNASAVRISVPTLPGSASRQRARHASRTPVAAGRPGGRRRSRAPGAASVETRASSSASTVSPAIAAASTGSTTGRASRAATRSSPSATKRPLSSRCFRCRAASARA